MEVEMEVRGPVFSVQGGRDSVGFVVDVLCDWFDGWGSNAMVGRWHGRLLWFGLD